MISGPVDTQVKCSDIIAAFGEGSRIKKIAVISLIVP